MANYNGDNYAAQFVTKPSSKFPKGENGGRKRFLMDRYTLSTAATLLVGDRILLGYIPASSIVTDAKVKIDKSLGATGIFSLGYLANGVDAEDANAFIAAADGGGQAVLQRAAAGDVGIYKRFTVQTQVILDVTEVLDGTVLDAIIEAEIEFVND